MSAFPWQEDETPGGTQLLPTSGYAGGTQLVDTQVLPEHQPPAAARHSHYAADTYRNPEDDSETEDEESAFLVLSLIHI